MLGPRYRGCRGCRRHKLHHFRRAEPGVQPDDGHHRDVDLGKGIGRHRGRTSVGHSFFAGRGLVHEPDELTDRPYPGGRSRAAPRADCSQDGSLLPTRHQKRHTPTAVDHGISHGDAGLGAPVRDGRHPSLTLLQHRFSRQQRSRMAVGTKAKQGQVEERTGRIEYRPAVRLMQGLFVAAGRVLGAPIGWDWVNILRWHRAFVSIASRTMR